MLILKFQIQDNYFLNKIITEIMIVKELIKSLELSQHPEGGWYKETYTSQITTSGRSIISMIYYLLKKDEVSRWHRVTDADELWLWHLGHPLMLSYSDNKSIKKDIKLGSNIAQGEKLQAVIPKSIWQSAQSTGDWSLVSCIVAPAFSFNGFEIANKGWEPKI